MSEKKYQSQVVRYSPRLRKMSIYAAAVMVVCLAALSFYLGGAAMRASKNSLETEFDALTQQHQQQKGKLADALQNAANLKMGAAVDRASVDDLRTDLSDRERRILDLKEEIDFYRGLMAPGDRERGLGIRSWEVTTTREEGVFKYRLVVQQLAVKHRLLRGTVKVEILGKLNGKSVRYALADVDSGRDAVSIKLRFKFFQPIEGRLAIPPGFLPEQVLVIAKSSVPVKGAVSERSFKWSVNGG